jgi:hypothetical protein
MSSYQFRPFKDFLFWIIVFVAIMVCTAYGVEHFVR